RELDLLGRREEVDLADVLQEELERVGRDLELDRLLVVEGGSPEGKPLDLAGGQERFSLLLVIVEEGPSLVLAHVDPPPFARPPPRGLRRMRPSCNPTGRIHRPSGSFHQSVRLISATSRSHPLRRGR